RHGWQQLEGPFVATRTEKNVIHELNWQNAFDLYKEVIDQDCTIPITKDNFFDIAKAYPFGIFKENSEDIVRDPIAVDENGALVCVGEVPENTVLYILKGEKNALISSAKRAAEDTLSEDMPEIAQTLIVDCISRTLFLENDFSEELKVVSECFNKTNQPIHPQGILTLGEISSYGEGYLEFFNKTIVIGTFFK
ncbi:MAG: FIST signal transduction protein, partial [Chitinophagales bacterium]